MTTTNLPEAPKLPGRTGNSNAAESRQESIFVGGIAVWLFVPRPVMVIALPPVAPERHLFSRKNVFWRLPTMGTTPPGFVLLGDDMRLTEKPDDVCPGIATWPLVGLTTSDAGPVVVIAPGDAKGLNTSISAGLNAAVS
jgi:hypothetical protein